jgi:ectoine hydroxylase-related dioxygenase (phytanoyl-CoA dioxygenase family)
MPAGYMCGVWVALEDIDMDNGPLIYYPGSHKLPELTMQDIGAKPEQDEYPKYEQHIGELIEREGLEIAYATISKGQALVWASNLLHGGAPQRDRSRTRLSLVTHYVFEGCKYYTPMLTDESNVFWRDPAWVV